MLVKNVLANTSLGIFENYFTKTNEIHDHLTRHSSQNSVVIDNTNTTHYGYYSVKHSAALTWNLMQDKIPINMLTESPTKVKKILKKHFLEAYKVQ